GGHGARCDRPPYGSADLPVGQWRDELDVGPVDERAGGVDVETGEAVDLGQADLQDRQVALQERLLVDDQVEVAALDRVHRGRPEVEAGEVDVVRPQPGRGRVGLRGGGERAVVGDHDRQVRVGGDHAGERGDTGLGVGVRGRV